MTASTWNTHLKHYAHWLQAAGRTPRTVETRLNWIKSLQRFAESNPEDVTAEILTHWLANPGWKPNSRRSALASARGFFRFLLKTGVLSTDPTELLLPIRVPRAKARPLPTEVIVAALKKSTCAEHSLMILLGAYAGLRRTEIASLHTDNYSTGWLTVTGKGNVTRVIPVHPVLEPYLQLKTCGFYFPGRFKGHRSNDNVARKISALLGTGYTSHHLRHWFATTAYAHTQDIRAVQELLGHADIATTQVYIGIEDTSLCAVVERIPSIC